MRTLILLLVVLSVGNAFAQKHKKSKKGVESFDYSYRLNSGDYRHHIMYDIQVTEYNTDSVLVTCSPDTSNVSGTISYSYNLVSGTTYSTDGSFRVKVAKNELQNTTLNLVIQLEGYDESHIQADLFDYPDEFFVFIGEQSIFDEETPYIMVYSAYPMTKSELKQLVNCLSASKLEKQNCYDEKKVRFVIPI